ncbi:unnamed protein product [Prunus armeniaca]
MTRKKVKLAWITNDSARKTNFRIRKEGLRDKEPVVWPSNPIAEELLARFQRIPEVDRCMKMMNQETYLKDRLAKLKEQLTKLIERTKR